MKLFLFTLFFILSQNSKASTTKVDSILGVLNKEIANKEIYRIEKENKIKELKASLRHVESKEDKFSLSNKIYDEYKSYQYDSAYVYAVKTQMLAEEIGDPELKMQVKVNLLFCFMSSGLFKEAVDIIRSVKVNDVSDELKAMFYSQCARLYSDLMKYNSTEPYKTEYFSNSIRYCDSVLMYSDKDSYAYNVVMGLKNQDAMSDDRVGVYLKQIDSPDVTSHQLAIAALNLGNLYMDKGDEEKAVYYLALSAIADIRASITETTSKTILAKCLYLQGEVKDAGEYIQAALDEANFYNARHRKMDIHSLLPIIGRERLDSVRQQRNNLTWSLLTVSVLSALFLVSAITNCRQNRKLKEAKLVIQKQLNELSEINEKLNAANEKLQESNEIKDKYIFRTLYGKSEYLDKTEFFFRRLDNYLKARRYSDVSGLYKEFNLKKEREKIFLSFDKAFLELFPWFVEKYNELFPESERVNLSDSNILPPELRIFALIRLGINENEKIAKFLNLSVNTIYVYKAKTKAKSVVPKEEFENRIMQIRKK